MSAAELLDAYRAKKLSPVEALNGCITRIEEVSAGILNASEALDAQGRATQLASQKQREAAERIASAVEELSQSIIDVARHADQTAAVSAQARSASESGNQHALHAGSRMTETMNMARSASETVASLYGSSVAITRVIGAIREIADQTNLLALNAAIEAARAGESGRGFAVVADEVRKLADSTGKATREIATSIGSIQQRVRDTTDLMQNNESHARQSADALESLTASLSHIAGQVREATGHVASIASKTAGQRDSSSKIALATQEMTVMAEENHVRAASTLGAIGHLRELVQGLQSSIGELKSV